MDVVLILDLSLFFFDFIQLFLQGQSCLCLTKCRDLLYVRLYAAVGPAAGEGLAFEDQFFSVGVRKSLPEYEGHSENAGHSEAAEYVMRLQGCGKERAGMTFPEASPPG